MTNNLVEGPNPHGEGSPRGFDVDLSDRTALVTGAGSGIGRGIAMELARGGAAVVVNDISSELAEETAGLLRDLGTKALVGVADVSRSEHVDALMADLEAQGTGIDILVNNAGISLYRPILECSEEDWDAHLNIMAKGTFLMMRRFTPQMIDRGWGRIVNLGSYVAQLNCATEFFGPYVAAKMGIVGLTQVAAQEFAPFVTVNAVGPGDVDTSMMAREWELEAERRSSSAAEIKKEYEERLLLGRLERPSDIASAVGFLCSSAASQITGSHMIVGGGLPFTR